MKNICHHLNKVAGPPSSSSTGPIHSKNDEDALEYSKLIRDDSSFLGICIKLNRICKKYPYIYQYAIIYWSSHTLVAT